MVRSAICKEEEPVSLGPVLNSATDASSREGRDILFAATTCSCARCAAGRPATRRETGVARAAALNPVYDDTRGERTGEGAAVRRRFRAASEASTTNPEPIGFCVAQPSDGTGRRRSPRRERKRGRREYGLRGTCGLRSIGRGTCERGRPCRTTRPNGETREDGRQSLGFTTRRGDVSGRETHRSRRTGCWRRREARPWTWRSS